MSKIQKEKNIFLLHSEPLSPAFSSVRSYAESAAYADANFLLKGGHLYAVPLKLQMAISDYMIRLINTFISFVR